MNLLAPLPTDNGSELFTSLLEHRAARIERIVSRGQVTPEDEPYDQQHDEWVLLLAGAARLWLEDSGELSLAPGDALMIPAHVKHRVTFTQAEPPTVWLAVHLGSD